MWFTSKIQARLWFHIILFSPLFGGNDPIWRDDNIFQIRVGKNKPPTWKVPLDQPFALEAGGSGRMQRRLWPASRMRRFAVAKQKDLRRIVYHLGLVFILTKCDPKSDKGSGFPLKIGGRTMKNLWSYRGLAGGSDEEPTQCLHLWEDQDAERIRGEFWVLSWG